MKKIISLSLALIMLMAVMTGCGATPIVEEPLPNEPVESQLPNIPDSDIKMPEKEDPQREENLSTKTELEITNMGFNEFDSELIEFLHINKAMENYMVSPLSFRYAMALATAGAVGETQEELLASVGFKSMNEYLEWTSKINSITENFDAHLAQDIEDFKRWGYGDKEPFRALKIANSIWHNTDKEGTIKNSYIDYAAENFKATADNIPQKELIDKVNGWVDEQTNGLIPSLLGSGAEEANTILVNTLYLKSPWINTFDEYATKEDDFTTVGGGKVKKEFMHQQESFRYYEDEDSKLVIMPMAGGINMAVVLGNNENILDKISKTTSEEVIIQMPKFEVETSYDKKELINYLQYKGVDLALRREGGADFSTMIDDAELYIDDIIQKTKITVDENGTEAAAATAIVMMETSAIIMPKEPKEFIANEPFTYYIYTNTESTPELLFFGQYVQ